MQSISDRNNYYQDEYMYRQPVRPVPYGRSASRERTATKPTLYGRWKKLGTLWKVIIILVLLLILAAGVTVLTLYLIRRENNKLEPPYHQPASDVPPR